MSPDPIERFGRTAARLLGTEHPIVLGPMAGGPSTQPLAAAVSNAGGLGSLGAGYVAPERLRQDIRDLRSLTPRPFAVNLFAPEPVTPDPEQVARALETIRPYRSEVGLGFQEPPERFGEDFGEQLDVVVAEQVDVFTFTFGLLRPEDVERLQRGGCRVGGTATTVREAKALEASGVDFICAQGAEAGGHRGSFLASPGDDLIGLVALVPQIRDAVSLPVVAAGGIADGRGVAAALVAGACAAQLGTAFLLCPEAGTSPAYREAIRRAEPDETVITDVFSGRRARGVRNRFARELAGWRDHPPYPVLNALTRELRQRAAEEGRAEFLSLWAGQAVGLRREVPAGELVALLVEEANRALAGPGDGG